MRPQNAAARERGKARLGECGLAGVVATDTLAPLSQVHCQGESRFSSIKRKILRVRKPSAARAPASRLSEERDVRTMYSSHGESQVHDTRQSSREIVDPPSVTPAITSFLSLFPSLLSYQRRIARVHGTRHGSVASLVALRAPTCNLFRICRSIRARTRES